MELHEVVVSRASQILATKWWPYLRNALFASFGYATLYFYNSNILSAELMVSLLFVEGMLFASAVHFTTKATNAPFKTARYGNPQSSIAELKPQKSFFKTNLGGFEPAAKAGSVTRH